MAVIAFQYVNTKHYDNVLQPSNGIEGVLQGAMLTFYGYVGFDVQNQMTRETINPNQNIPRAMIITMAICIVIYCSFSFLVTGIGIVDAARTEDADTALALAFKNVGASWIAQLIYWAAMFGVAAASLTNYMG